MKFKTFNIIAILRELKGVMVINKLKSFYKLSRILRFLLNLLMISIVHQGQSIIPKS